MAKPIVNIHAAKTQLSKLVDRAEAGEEIVIARGGKPVVRLVPLRSRVSREPGLLRGRVKMAADFDAPLSGEALAMFIESPLEPRSKRRSSAPR